MLVHVKSDDFCFQSQTKEDHHHSSSSSSGMLILYQNIAPCSGKLQGKLPIRAIPTLQAPRIRTLPSYSLFAIQKRKLIQDQVWIQLTTFQDELTVEKEEAWVVERNIHTGQQVAVPWGILHQKQEKEVRYYRNIYSKKPVLALRKEPNVSSECIGTVEMGTVFASTRQKLTQDGRLWIQVPLCGRQQKDTTTTDSTSTESDTTTYGWVIQFTTKKNTMVVEEIPCPGNFSSPMFYQVDQEEEKELVAYAEPSSSSLECFSIRNHSFLQVKGTIYNKETKEMWAMVSTHTLDCESILCSSSSSSGRRNTEEMNNKLLRQQLHTVYLPMVMVLQSSSLSIVVKKVLRPIYRSMRSLSKEHTRQHHPHTPHDGRKVVFTGRASKLFGNLTIGSMDKTWNSSQRVASAVGDDDKEIEEKNLWRKTNQQHSSLRNCTSKIQQKFINLLQISLNCLRIETNSLQAYAHLEKEEEEIETLL
jgi:hypothetical protein